MNAVADPNPPASPAPGTYDPPVQQMWCNEWECYVNAVIGTYNEGDDDYFGQVWTHEWGHVNALIPAKRQRTGEPVADDADAPTHGDKGGKSKGKKGGKGGGKRGPRKGGPCWQCGGPHFQRECPENEGKAKGKGYPSPTTTAWSSWRPASYPGPDPATWRSWFPKGKGKGKGMYGMGEAPPLGSITATSQPCDVKNMQFGGWINAVSEVTEPIANDAETMEGPVQAWNLVENPNKLQRAKRKVKFIKTREFDNSIHNSCSYNSFNAFGEEENAEQMPNSSNSSMQDMSNVAPPPAPHAVTRPARRSARTTMSWCTLDCSCGDHPLPAVG